MFSRLFKAKGRAPASDPAPASPSVPAGQRVYAIGDIHGRADLLNRLLGLIEADNAARDEAEVLLIYLGDYIDRGPHSREVIDRVLGEHPFADRVIPLRGNHEDALLAFIEDPARGRVWFDWGGMATLLSYGVRVPADMPAAERPAFMASELDRLLPDEHRELYRTMPLSETVGDYLFVHAGVNPMMPLDRQDAFDLTTIRSPFLDWGRPLGKMVVHGHSISEAPEFLSWRIGIDTGAYATGRLTALVLEGESRRIVTT
jgi:serine/threonine protein phosphatase 1